MINYNSGGPQEFAFGPGGPIANQAQPPQYYAQPAPTAPVAARPVAAPATTGSFVPTPARPSTPAPVQKPPAAPMSEGRMRLAQALIGKQQEVQNPMQAIGNATSQMAQAYVDKKQAAMKPKPLAALRSRPATMKPRTTPRGY